ncbi:MAG: exosortase/archaeosortase family protein [Acidobacteriota bacterium]
MTPTDVPSVFRDHTRRDQLLMVVVAGGVLALYGSLLRGLWFDWLHDPNYSHGVLVLPVVGWLLWRRRRELRDLERRPSYTGALIVGASLCLFLVGQAAVEFFVTRLSFLGVVAGLIVQLAGWRHLRVCLFPLCLIALAIPLPTLIFNQIAFPLQLLASRCGEVALQLFNVPVIREGNVIRLNNATLEVAEACSGVRSLISLGTLAVVYGYLGGQTMRARTLIVLSVLPIVVFANGLRVAGAGVLAQLYGAKAAAGFLHSFSGWLFFGVAVLMLAAAERAVMAMPWSGMRRPPPSVSPA